MKNLIKATALVLSLGLTVSTGGAATTRTKNSALDFKVSINVKVIDNVDGNAAQVKEHFTEAFESLGVEVVEPGDGGDDTIDLDITTGRDDADDDNDGIPDTKDNDDDGDGEDDAKEEIETIDLDTEVGSLTDDFVDKDKSSGIYFEIDGDDGIDMEFVTDADSLDTAAAPVSALFTGNGFFQKAGFSPVKKFTTLIPSADCLRQKMALRASLARCKNAACKTSINAKAGALGCV